MNGSRSNTPNIGGKSSLDQLNRTIEGLEARIQGLMVDKGADRRPASSSDPMSEIMERQRSLATPRDRVSTVMERAPRADFQPRTQPAWAEPEVRAAAPQYQAPAYQAPQQVAAPLNDKALAEISETLAALRAEIKQSVSEGLGNNFEEIRKDMRGLKNATANVNGGTEAMREDLALLGFSLEKLENQSRSFDTGHLRADIDDIRSMIGSLAREDSMRNLEKRWEKTETKLAAVDPSALKEEIVQLAWRIDDIKSGLGEMGAAPAVRALEDKLIAIASSIEMLGRNVQSNKDLSGQFAGLDLRLDEISRAIASGASKGTSAADSTTLLRLENRINDLVDHVGAMNRASPENDIAVRIETLAARIEEIADEEAARKLEDRIGQLSNLIERNFRESAANPGMATHLADISRKIDGLGGNQAEDLIQRLELLARKIDEIEVTAAPAHLASADVATMSRLESRLSDIAMRLDETAAAPSADTSALRNLEQQIAGLSALINQPSAASSFTAMPDGVTQRMMAIEDYIASSDEFIVEAARQAAETVVEAYSRNGFGGNGASAADISALAGLAEDLRSLEAHTRSSEERTQATFEALHETLVQIAGRLNDFGNNTPAAAPAREFVEERTPEPAAMPRAMQPDFSATRALLEEQPVRRPPENLKVDVFEEPDMVRAEAVQTEVLVAEAVAQPVAAKEAAPSKSLLAGLAAKFKNPKKEKPTSDGRVAVDPAPALDPGEMVVSDSNNLLLEPGSGVPDVKKILQKVRAGQQTQAKDAGATSQSDVIAAARRAAQAAATEAGSQKFIQSAPDKTGTKGKDGKVKVTQPSKSILGGENRRPILLAAAAVLLVVMSYPLVSNLISGRDSETAVQPVDRAVTVPIDQNSAIDAEKSADVATNVQPVEAEKPVEQAAAPVVEQDQTATATDQMMAPADADQASKLETPAATDLTVPAETASTVDTAEAPVETATTPLDANTALDADPSKTTADTADTTTEMPAPLTTELPAGLKPASLVEAAKKGDPLAYFEIGSRFTDGRGTKVDLAEASKWYGLAAEKGLAPAEYRLANLYEKGTGVERNVEHAKRLYMSAAEKGNASAMHNLAVLFATGVGGVPDFAEAAKWFKDAADLNVRDSQFNLAILYARGNGVPQDLEESYKWFAIAAKEGDQDAAQKRDEVANAMKPDQLKSAKAKLDLWKAKPMDDNANAPMVPDDWIAKANTTASVDMKRAIRNIQAILNNNGFDAGTPDGAMGKKTVSAIKAFQKSVKLEPTGKIDDQLVKELLARNKKS